MNTCEFVDDYGRRCTGKNIYTARLSSPFCRLHHKRGETQRKRATECELLESWVGNKSQIMEDIRALADLGVVPMDEMHAMAARLLRDVIYCDNNDGEEAKIVDGFVKLFKKNSARATRLRAEITAREKAIAWRQERAEAKKALEKESKK